MGKIQTLAIVVPDDMADPAELVKNALEHYLERGNRWREIHIWPSTVAPFDISEVNGEP